MFDNIKLLMKLRPVAEKFRAVLKMRFGVNMVIQILACAIQAYNQVGDLIPPDRREDVAVVVGILQAVVALLAHYYNPDGTAVATPYVKKSK